MKINRYVVICSAVLLITGLAGCSSPDAGEGRPKISFVTTVVTDAYWQQAKCAGQATADDLGFDFDFQGPQAFDVAAQLQTLAAVTQAKPDALVVVPTDPNSFVAPVQAALDAGIPVVTQDGKLTDPIDAQNVRTDGAKAGAMAADALGELMSGTGQVLVQGTVSSIPTLAARVDGFVAQMAEKFPDIDVLPTQYSNGSVSKSASDAENVIRANPGVTGVYSVTSFEAGPTANGLTAAGVLGDVNWVAWDTTEAEIGLLKDGSIDALVAQDPVGQTKAALTSAYELATGAKTTDDLEKEVFIPATLVTLDNLEDDDIRPLYEISC
ncbi:substrate-binding domain-containing protein [Microbacterium jepli]|uniref:substrate-binding domain-containing protein n=1 Tax=Microbacterium sp. 1P10UE TaxID=3132288 RepID=UPI0039A15771